ncbi:glycosyltransferase family 39 protein [bacterium]|nr:glycosyltransferase family 39 protein [bacterium]
MMKSLFRRVVEPQTATRIGTILLVFLSSMAMLNGIATQSLLLDETFFVRNLQNFPDGMVIGSAPSPPLYYLLTLLFTKVIGMSEGVLRLIPFLFAFFSVLILVKYLFAHLSGLTALVSLFLIVFSHPFVHYAGNAHPFTADVFATAAMFYLTIKVLNDDSVRRWLEWCVLALISLTLSYGAVFIVAGFGLVLLINDLVQKKRDLAIRHFLGLISLGLVVVVLLFTVFLKQKGNIDAAFYSNHVTSFPASLKPWVVAKWSLNSSRDMLGYFFCGYESGAAVFLLMTMGIAQLLKEKKNILCALILSPIILSWVGSVIHVWPYGPFRTMLFVMPLTLILVGYGLEMIWKYKWNGIARWVILVTFSLILLPQIWVMKMAVIPEKDNIEAVRTLAATMESQIEPADQFLVYYSAEVQFKYYFPGRVDKAVFQPWSNKGDKALQKEFVEKHMNMGQGRMWLVFSHFENSIADMEYMVEMAHSYAELKKTIALPNCSALLFQFDRDNFEER